MKYISKTIGVLSVVISIALFGKIGFLFLVLGLTLLFTKKEDWQKNNSADFLLKIKGKIKTWIISAAVLAGIAAVFYLASEVYHIGEGGMILMPLVLVAGIVALGFIKDSISTPLASLVNWSYFDNKYKTAIVSIVLIGAALWLSIYKLFEYLSVF